MWKAESQVNIGTKPVVGKIQAKIIFPKQYFFLEKFSPY